MGIMDMSLRLKHASTVWLEINRIYAGGQCYYFTENSMLEVITKALHALPAAPTYWIIDDLIMPALLLYNVTELPQDAVTRDEFLNWRYHQYLCLDLPHFVQSINIEQDTWLLVGLRQELMDTWLKLAESINRPIYSMMPRWVWLYNRLAPTRESPGLLLSIASSDGKSFTGSLIAWKKNLVLLRQWHDPISIDKWNDERIIPTIAYLQRELCSPAELNIWGSANWPDCGIPIKIIQPEIPTKELI
jgi:hypothetical protein